MQAFLTSVQVLLKRTGLYRCVLEDGKLVMKFINMVKIFYELNKTVSPSRKKSPEVV